jgi:hypothetical protein
MSSNYNTSDGMKLYHTTIMKPQKTEYDGLSEELYLILETFKDHVIESHWTTNVVPMKAVYLACRPVSHRILLRCLSTLRVVHSMTNVT